MSQSFLEVLEEIEDPRRGNAIKYRLQDIILTGVLAIISNMDDYTEMAIFAEHQQEYLEKICDFSQGTPSHDTFGKVFSRLDPAVLSEKFTGWALELRQRLGNLIGPDGQVIAIDGKTIKGSGGSEQKAIHIVSAFATEMELVLAQIKTAAKSNEITAIPCLLQMFSLKGSIITIDAMGTQKEIARAIIDKEADYVLAVKKNQKGIYDDVSYHIDGIRKEHGKKALQEAGQYAVSKEKDHGRIEIRECYVSGETGWFDWKEAWAGLKGSGLIISRRQEGNKPETVEYHYFIHSLSGATAADLLKIKRSHWGIENKLHWMLDMAFKEDDSRARIGNSAEVLNVLRKLALHMLKTQSPYKYGMKAKRK